MPEGLLLPIHGGEQPRVKADPTGENLISFAEVIDRVKRAGLKFGKTTPTNRLRYLTKIGLLPKAVRKSFAGQPPSGAYPEYVVDILIQIDRELKAGKSVQAILREQRAENSEQQENAQEQTVAVGLPAVMV